MQEQNSMRNLQQKVPKRVDQRGNQIQSPRLAQTQRIQAQQSASAISQIANKKTDKWLIWLAGGGTIGAAGISTWLLT